MPAQHVGPYPRGNKNDRRDADALLEAGRCDDIVPVPIESVTQQAAIQLHRLREQWKTTRTARINSLRGALRQIEGIGLLNATAIVATAGSASHFPSGRQFATWLGITPRESSSGFRRNLGRITKRWDVCLRTLLIHGARSVLTRTKQLNRIDPTRLSRLRQWGLQSQQRIGHNKAAVALANKLARICWAVWRTDTAYQPCYGA